MKGEPLHVKVVLRVKPEYREAFERELMGGTGEEHCREGMLGV
jgi:hypothetical protein